MQDRALLNFRACHQGRSLNYAFSSARQPWCTRHSARQVSKRLCGCSTRTKASSSGQSESSDSPQPAAEESAFARERASLSSIADTLRGQQSSNSTSRLHANDSQAGPVLERAFLVGVAQKGHRDKFAYNIHESLEELGRLAETAGLEVGDASLSPCMTPLGVLLSFHRTVKLRCMSMLFDVRKLAMYSTYCQSSFSTWHPVLPLQTGKLTE